VTTAVVVGGSRGIGAAVARRLAADGFDVVLGYATDKVAADEVAGELTGAGVRAVAVRADVRSAGEVDRLFDTAEEEFGGAAVVVNCAGAHAGARGPLAETTDADFEHVVDVNLRGTFTVLRAAANRLRPGGRIIAFSSSAATLGVPGQAVYNAAKLAVESLVRQLAKELAGRDVAVNAVAPGPTATELFRSRRTGAEIDALAQQVPLRRIGEPEDVADLVGFLAGPRGGWINGQVLHANGGIV
jgi:3-oxoacyl-[acyl-carrier protein] reductase